jgi:hypothetical protein
MMDRKEQWIDDIMNSLDNLSPAQAPSRLNNRILTAVANARNARLSPVISWSLAAGLLLLISLNVLTVGHLKENVSRQLTHDFAQEYYRSVSN